MITPNTKPLVTVIVPCFNTALYLAATLKSVQAQTFRDFEVINHDGRRLLLANIPKYGGARLSMLRK